MFKSLHNLRIKFKTEFAVAKVGEAKMVVDIYSDLHADWLFSRYCLPAACASLLEYCVCVQLLFVKDILWPNNPSIECLFCVFSKQINWFIKLSCPVK